MELSATVGGELDLVSGPELKAGLNQLHDRLAKKLDKDRGVRKRIPMSPTIPPSSTGTWVLDFGSPPPDCIWWIQEVVIQGVDDHTNLAGAFATLYIGIPPQQQTNAIQQVPPPAELLRPGIAVPGLFPFSGEAVAVQDGENLFAIVYSPTTSTTQIAGVATIVEVKSELFMTNLLR